MLTPLDLAILRHLDTGGPDGAVAICAAHPKLQRGWVILGLEHLRLAGYLDTAGAATLDPATGRQATEAIYQLAAKGEQTLTGLAEARALYRASLAASHPSAGGDAA